MNNEWIIKGTLYDAANGALDVVPGGPAVCRGQGTLWAQSHPWTQGNQTHQTIIIII